MDKAEELKTGVYKIINKVTGKVYIGMSESDINTRLYSHESCLKYNRHTNKRLQYDYNKYGAENFEFIIIELIPRGTELHTAEHEYIEKYNSNNKDFGYNCNFSELRETVNRKIYRRKRIKRKIKSIFYKVFHPSVWT